MDERRQPTPSPLTSEPDWTGDEKPPVICMHVSDSTATPRNVAAFIDRLNGGLTTQATHLKGLLEAGHRVLIGAVGGKMAAFIHTKPEAEPKPRLNRKTAVIIGTSVVGLAAAAGLIELALVTRKHAQRRAKEKEAKQ